MKELLAVISLIVAVSGEPPAPYPPSGWRPSGPAFQLPQRGQFQPQRPQYLPPLDPRNPTPSVESEYGVPEEDVSVQGLPVQEQQPIFQVSPINGPQISGPGFNFDIRNLDQSQNQLQYQQQQERYRQLERQRQLDAQAKFNPNGLPNPQTPRQFARTTPAPTEATTTQKPEERTTEQTTEQSLNQGETLDDEPVLVQQKGKTSVEVSRQNLQEYPGELFLSSLAQLKLQPQFVPLQQLQSQLYLQPVDRQSQKQVSGYDAQAHFAAFPSVLAQQQAQKVQPSYQNPALLMQQPLAQYQPMVSYQPAQPAQQYQPQYQPIVLQPQQIQPGQFAAAPEIQQPVPQYQPVPQFQATPVVVQPQAVNQAGQFQPNPDAERVQPEQNGPYPQQPVQYQPALQAGIPQFQGAPVIFQQQPINQQGQYQPNPDAEKVQPQQEQYPQYPQYQQNPAQLYQQPILIPQALNQDPAYQYYPSQFQQQTLQDSLQSGLDVNQQGNDIDQTEEQDDETEQQDDGSATAVATAFGARTRPRVFAEYGVPFPVPRVQASPSTTESPVEDVTDEAPVVAQAVAVAGGNRKSAKLRQRSRRLRPVFTLDRSGHLVLAQDQ